MGTGKLGVAFRHARDGTKTPEESKRGRSQAGGRMAEVGAVVPVSSLTIDDMTWLYFAALADGGAVNVTIVIRDDTRGQCEQLARAVLREMFAEGLCLPVSMNTASRGVLALYIPLFSGREVEEVPRKLHPGVLI